MKNDPASFNRNDVSLMKTPYQTIRQISSSRQYTLFLSSANKPVTHSLQDILHYSISEDYEWAHAICDKLDDLLDLRIAECMFFHPNRDDKDSRREHGIIKRIR